MRSALSRTVLLCTFVLLLLATGLCCQGRSSASADNQWQCGSDRGVLAEVADGACDQWTDTARQGKYDHDDLGHQFVVVNMANKSKPIVLCELPIQAYRYGGIRRSIRSAHVLMACPWWRLRTSVLCSCRKLCTSWTACWPSAMTRSSGDGPQRRTSMRLAHK